MSPFARLPAFPRVSTRISSKLILSLAIVISLVFAAIFAAFIYAVSLLNEKQNDLAQLMRDLNGDLRQNVLALQASYLSVPKFLETDSVADVTEWIQGKHQATVTDHQGREAVVKRYTDRRIRRDLQKPGFFAVETIGNGVSVSFGQFKNREYQEAVREFIIPGADADAIKQGVEAVIAETSGPGAVERRVLALASKLTDEALAAESARTAILSAADIIQAKEAEVGEFVQQIDYGVIVLGLIGVCVATLTLHLVARSVVTSPLRTISSVMTRIVQREGATVPYLERTDEIGAIARGLEEFRAVLTENERFQRAQSKEHEAQRERAELTETRIADFNQSAGAIAQAVARAARDMQGIAGTTTATAKEIGDRVTAVSTASDQARSHVETAASAIEQLRASIEEISARAGSAAETARDAVNRAKATDRTVGRLSEMAREVDRIVEIISEIANQTNLLALNATIEAARAGEAGKGFAVVASEVKALASQTAKATNDISSRIQAMHQVTSDSVSAIQSIGEAINRIDGITSSTVSVVEGERTTIRAIFESMELTGQVTHNVVQHIQGVGEATARNDSVAQQVLEASAVLSGQAELLHTRVSTFIEDIRLVNG